MVNWDAIGAIAELPGAAGVVATLATLAGQIRQNSAVVRISNYWQLSAKFVEFSQELVKDPELMEQLESRGFIDTDMYREQFGGLSVLLALPGVEQWWATARHWYSPTFRRYIDSTMQGSAGPTEARRVTRASWASQIW